MQWHEIIVSCDLWKIGNFEKKFHIKHDIQTERNNQAHSDINIKYPQENPIYL